MLFYATLFSVSLFIDMLFSHILFIVILLHKRKLYWSSVDSYNLVLWSLVCSFLHSYTHPCLFAPAEFQKQVGQQTGVCWLEENTHGSYSGRIGPRAGSRILKKKLFCLLWILMTVTLDFVYLCYIMGIVVKCLSILSCWFMGQWRFMLIKLASRCLFRVYCKLSCARTIKNCHPCACCLS